jgi:hypothetical protein
VNKPQFCDPKFLHRIFEANKNNDLLLKNMKKIKDGYKKNVQVSFVIYFQIGWKKYFFLHTQEKDRYYRSQNMLWIWFLTEPKKVLVAIKEVTQAAANTQSAAFKNISGIIRKN